MLVDTPFFKASGSAVESLLSLFTQVVLGLPAKQRSFGYRARGLALEQAVLERRVLNPASLSLQSCRCTHTIIEEQNSV